MTKWVASGFAILLAVIALVIAQQGLQRGPALTSPNSNNGVTEGAPNIRQGDTVTVGGILGCLDRAGSVTVTGIAPLDGVGLQVTGWAIRPNPYWKPPQSPDRTEGLMLGVVHDGLGAFEFPASRVVDVQCGSNGEGFEIAVEVQKTTDEAAGAAGWVVTYLSDDDTKRLEVPRAFRLCREARAWARTCRALKF